MSYLREYAAILQKRLQVVEHDKAVLTIAERDLEAALAPGVPFYTQQLAIYRATIALPSQRHEREGISQVLDWLTSPETRRIVIDARQAQVFADSAPIPPEQQEKLQYPFPQFWLEFTEPILIGGRAVGAYCVVEAMWLADAPASQMVITFDPSGQGNAFMLDLPTGQVISRMKAENQRFFSITPDATIQERMEYHAHLLAWCVAYMMASNLELERHTEILTRQQRRHLDRIGERPLDWYTLRVRLPKNKLEAGSMEGEGTRHHSYRYDVIGHLRFGHHKTRKGYRDQIEFVRPHQRGLRHELYIPKTYRMTVQE